MVSGMTSTTRHHLGTLLLLAITLGFTGLLGGVVLAGQPTTPVMPVIPVIPVSQSAPAMGCWTEWHEDGTAERMYGDLALAPQDSTPLDCEGFSGPADSADEPQVEEDDPRWDCRTMGNLVCGEGATVAGVSVPAGDYGDGDRVAGPVGACLAGLGYSAGPVVRADAEWCAQL